MKSPSDINDKKLNVIVSVCLVKLKTGYENKNNKLLLAKLQLISRNIIIKTIISSFITSTYSFIIYNIRGIVRKTPNNAITTKTKPINKQSESELRSFQEASSLIMLHRLPSFCQHKKQQQQHKQQYSNKQKLQQQKVCHQQQTTGESASFLTTGQELQIYKHKLRRHNNNITKSNTKSTFSTKNISSKSNIKSNIIRTEGALLFASPTSTSTTTPTTSRLSKNYCLQIQNTNNTHRVINCSISEKKNTNCHCWNHNRNQKQRNILRKNSKLYTVVVNQYKELYSTSVRKPLETPARFNVSLFFASLFSSFLLLSSLTASLLLSSLSSLKSNFKQQQTWCVLLSFSSNLILLTKTSLTSTSSSFLFTSLEFVANQV